jgi:hypothetical protein
MGEASIGEQIGFQVHERVSSRLQSTLFSPIVLLIAEQSSQEVTQQVDHQLFSTWSQYIGVKVEIENRIKEDYSGQRRTDTERILSPDAEPDLDADQ